MCWIKPRTMFLILYLGFLNHYADSESLTRKFDSYETLTKYDNIIRTIINKRQSKETVTNKQQSKHKKVPSRERPSFKDYNFLKKSECPPLSEETKLYFCPTPDDQGHWSCIKYEELCDMTPQCPGFEDEDKVMCLFHRPVMNEMEEIGSKLGKLAEIIFHRFLEGRSQRAELHPAIASDLGLKNGLISNDKFEPEGLQRRSAIRRVYRAGKSSYMIVKDPSIEEYVRLTDTLK